MLGGLELWGGPKSLMVAGMSTTPNKYEYLAPKPDSFYRQLFVKGTRTAAWDLYALAMNAEEPMTPEEIAAGCGLPIEAVREAIAYCESNPPEIADDFRREEALAQATGRADPNNRHLGNPRRLTPQELARLLQ